MKCDVILIDTYTILYKKNKIEKLSNDGIHINKRAYEYLEDKIKKMMK